MTAAGLYAGLVLTLGGCIINNVFLELVTKGNIGTVEGEPDSISLYFADPGAGLLLTTVQYACVVACLLPYAIGFSAWVPGLPLPLPFVQLPQVPLSEYVVHVMVFLPMSALNNLAFQFPKVDQTLNVVIRSSHVVTTLAIGALAFGKRYTGQQAAAAVVVFLGAATFAISRTAGADSDAPIPSPDTPPTAPFTLDGLLQGAWQQRGALCLVGASMLGSFLTHMQGETNKRFRGKPEQATFWTHALCLLPLLVWTLEDLRPQGSRVLAAMGEGAGAGGGGIASTSSPPLISEQLQQEAIGKTAQRLLRSHPDTYTLGGALSPSLWPAGEWVSEPDSEHVIDASAALAAWSNASEARLGLESKLELWAGAGAPTACQGEGACGEALPAWLQWLARGIEGARGSGQEAVKSAGLTLGALPLLGLFVLLNGLSQVVCILGVQTLVAHADAMLISLVLTARKVLTMLLSVVLFRHQMSGVQVAAAAVTFAGIFVYSQLPRAQPPAPRRTVPERMPVAAGSKGATAAGSTEAPAAASTTTKKASKAVAAPNAAASRSPTAAPAGAVAYSKDERKLELMSLLAKDLRALCDERGVDRSGLTRKAQMVDALLEAEDEDIPEEAADGEAGETPPVVAPAAASNESDGEEEEEEDNDDDEDDVDVDGEEGEEGEPADASAPAGAVAYSKDERKLELMSLLAKDLRALCDEHGVDRSGLTRKAQMVDALLEAEDEDIPEEAAEGNPVGRESSGASSSRRRRSRGR